MPKDAREVVLKLLQDIVARELDNEEFIDTFKNLQLERLTDDMEEANATLDTFVKSHIVNLERLLIMKNEQMFEDDQCLQLIN